MTKRHGCLFPPEPASRPASRIRVTASAGSGSGWYWRWSRRLAIAVSGKGPVSFDAGRAAQNMLLAAWNEGIASCPNGLTDREAAHLMLELSEDESPVIVLSFGMPRRPRDPESRTAEEWSARANRRPLDEVVRRLR